MGTIYNPLGCLFDYEKTDTRKVSNISKIAGQMRLIVKSLNKMVCRIMKQITIFCNDDLRILLIKRVKQFGLKFFPS